jgi:hypothetical protein
MSSSDLIEHFLVVKCDIHGLMKFRPARNQYERDGWVCPGYDGEGCCNVTTAQAYQIRRGRPLSPKDPLLPITYSRYINHSDELVVNVPRRDIVHDDPED